MGAVTSSLKKSKSKIGRIYCFTVILESGRLYRFDGKDIGTFSLRGGACGKFTVENNGPGEQCSATISNDLGAILFSEGYYFGDSITFYDNPENGTTSVVYTKFGKCAAEHPIPIKARPNELIYLKGKRNFVITGSGANLECAGTGNVTVNGSIQRLKQTECSTIRIRGMVNGKVLQKCTKSRLFIEGNVTANLTQRGSSLIEVHGSVFGNIDQDGSGEIRVWGEHRGNLFRCGKGRVVIDNRAVRIME